MLPTIASPLLKSLIVAFLATLVVLYIARRALLKYGRHIPRRAYIGLPLVVLLAVFVSDGFLTVEPGTVRVVSFLGSVRERPYEAGFHFVIPGSRSYPMIVRRQIFELSGSSLDTPETPAPPSTTPAGAATTLASADTESRRTLALSNDRIPLSVDLAIPYQLSPDLAWKVYTLIGLNYEQKLLMPAASAALREAAASFSWTDAVSTKRNELEARIHVVAKSIVNRNLVSSGFTAEEAGRAFSFMPPQIRRMAPPRRILSAVADAKAAEEDLRRQVVLNEIALREAERRGHEGTGVRKLFDQLPKDMTTEQVRELLHALADKQRADSLQRAVEKGQAKVIVIGAGANPQVTVPAQ